jgi:hypothetical protein
MNSAKFWTKLRKHPAVFTRQLLQPRGTRQSHEKDPWIHSAGFDSELARPRWKETSLAGAVQLVRTRLN